MTACNKKKKNEHIINSVAPGSIAEELEIEIGDILLRINGEEIGDVFDYRYLINDEYLEVLIRKPDGEEWLLEIDKEYDEDLGIDFENSLMSDYRSCSNKCIFCFIDQMPKGMRETLYFKDDDSRLSFLQGNYITLTNMTEKDVDRIIQMQLAPINISVQTMNPELRCKMLNNRFAGEKLKFLDRLYEGCVEMNGQIVLCKGVNDGDELDFSIREMSKYLPFMRSVSVVPAGVTKYREGLFPLEPFTPEDAGKVIDQIEAYQQGFFEQYGLHFIHASDEWYITAGRPFPEEERYDGYIQLENGVGMMRLFTEEFSAELADLKKAMNGEDAENYTAKDGQWVKEYMSEPYIITMATGKLAYPTIKSFADQLMEVFPKLTINVFCIRNDFFGEAITVSGLITAQDLIAQLKEKRSEGTVLGDRLIIPGNMLRSGEKVFLDDLTTDDVQKELGLYVVPTGPTGADFIHAVIYVNYDMTTDKDARSRWREEPYEKID